MQKDQSLHSFKTASFDMRYAETGRFESDDPIVVWGHGWGQSGAAFLPLAQALRSGVQHFVVDFPGFGESPVPFKRPEDSWGSKEYADAAAKFIRSVNPDAKRPVIWVGHSFGCRVGTQLAAHYPDLVQAMVFVAGAGLKRKRTVIQHIVLWSKVRVYKLGKWLKAQPVIGDFLVRILGGHVAGSADYQNAGPMRGVLVKVVNEHLSAEAAQVTCPVTLIYGDKDTETPVDVGQSFHSLIKESELIVLEGQDHYSVLSDVGRHNVVLAIKSILKKVSKHG